MRRSGHRGCRTEHHVCCYSFCHWHESTTLNVRLPAPQAAAELWLHHGQPSAFESVTSNLVCLGNVDATKCTPCAAVMLAGCQSVDYVCFPPPPPSTRTPQITFIRHLQFRIACQYAGPGKIIAGKNPDTFDRSRTRLIPFTGNPWTPDHRDSRRAALWRESRSDSFFALCRFDANSLTCLSPISIAGLQPERFQPEQAIQAADGRCPRAGGP